MREIAPISEKLTSAGYLLSRGEFDKAEALLENVPPIIPQSSALYHVIGDQHGRHGEWKAAIANYSKAVRADPTNHFAYHYLAPLLVEVGDLDGYRQHREHALRQFGATSDPVIAERMAKDCLLLPPSPEQWPAINKLVQTAVAAGPSHEYWPYFQLVKGLAEYREGHFENALTWLQPVAADESDPARSVQASMFLAMAQQQLKKVDDARATLARGMRLAEAKVPPRDGLNWSDRRTAHILIREARQQIEGASGPAAPAP
jgi:tetratricopeptide (TPR) repeat protein